MLLVQQWVMSTSIKRDRELAGFIGGSTFKALMHANLDKLVRLFS